MCGISAIIHAAPDAAPVCREELELLRRELAPRGPDASGLWLAPDGRLGLAHTRLATQDARPSATQPIWDATGRVVVAFNGEIYNHRELREELRALGQEFKTASDSEVLPGGWLAWGPGLLSRIKGQYAFVLHDTADGRVLAARDPLGICPLYAAEWGGRLHLASTVRALLALPGSPRGLDVQAAHDFFVMDSAGWGRTLVAGVSSVRAGFGYLFTPGGPARLERQYALAPELFSRNGDRSEAQWVEAVRAELLAAAAACMRGDKEAGVYLSGGVDSLAVQALVKQAYPDLTVQTFSAGFAHCLDGEVVGELGFARDMAAHFGTVHHEVVVADRDLVASLGTFDLPAESILPTVVRMLAECAAASGVGVTLSGEGSDEIFFGYDHGLAVLGFLDPAFAWLRPTYALRGGYAAGLDPARAALTDVFRGGGVDIDLDDRRETLFGPAAGSTRSARDWAETLLADMRAALPGAERGHLDQLVMGLDLWHKLPEVFLRRGEGPSMAAGVEMRFPFLWPDLLDLMRRMPAAVRVGDGATSKPILRKALAGILPAEALARPKSPFGLPAARRTYFAGSAAGFDRPAFQHFFAKHLDPLSQALRDGAWRREDIIPARVLEERLAPQREPGTARFDPLLWKLWSFAAWYEEVLA